MTQSHQRSRLSSLALVLPPLLAAPAFGGPTRDAVAHDRTSMVGVLLRNGAPGDAVDAPFILDHNRMIVEVELKRADGTLRRAKAWVDTGTPNLTVAEALARELGVEVPSPLQPGRASLSPARAPTMSIGGMPLPMEGTSVLIMPGAVVRAGVPAELNIPASAFRQLHIVFDYAASRLALTTPGTTAPRGTAVRGAVNGQTGLVQIPVTLDGTETQLAIDVGSAGTWISQKVTESWRSRHREWPTARGAAGSANFFGFPFESRGLLVRLPELRIASHAVLGAAVLGVDTSLIDWYSQKTAAPVKGFLGANVLRQFRLEIDFTSGTTWWTPQRADEESFDRVGVTLRPLPDGRMQVASLVERDGRPTVEGVQPEDILLGVDALDAATASMGALMQALAGQLGEHRTLRLLRNGGIVTVSVPVKRIL